MKLYNLAFIYSAFNTGYSLTSPIKWAAATFGIAGSIQGMNLIWILIGTFIYFLSCIGVGILCFKHGWVDAIAEVSNQYNPFVKQMRKVIRYNGKQKVFK